MSKIEANTIDSISGTSTLTLGSSNASTITLKSGATLTNFPANTPAFLAYNVATQAVANNTNTQLNFGTELYDTASAFTSNTFTVPSGEGGKYFIGGGFRIDGGADAKYAQLNVYVNDSIVFNFTNRMVGDETHSFNGSITYTLSASDTVKLYTKQNSGSSQNYTSESGEKRQFFTMFKLIGA